MKKILVIVGMPGSGKTEAAKVAKKMGFNVFSFGDIIREEVRKRYGKLTKENDEKFSQYSYEKYRDRNLVNILRKKIGKKKNVVVEGARCPEQISELKKYYELKIIAITLPKKIRYKRQLARKRFGITMKDVVARDKRELSYGIDKVIKSADFRISNNCTKREFHHKVKKFFETNVSKTI